MKITLPRSYQADWKIFENTKEFIYLVTYNKNSEGITLGSSQNQLLYNQIIYFINFPIYF